MCGCQCMRQKEMRGSVTGQTECLRSVTRCIRRMCLCACLLYQKLEWGCKPWGSYVQLLTTGENGIQGPVPVQTQLARLDTGGIHIIRVCKFPLRGFYPDGLERGTGGGCWCCLRSPECCVFCLCWLVWLAMWIGILCTCVFLCISWDYVLNLVTGWSNELWGAAVTAPLPNSPVPFPLLFSSALPGSDASEISMCKMRKIDVAISSNFLS